MSIRTPISEEEPARPSYRPRHSKEENSGYREEEADDDEDFVKPPLLAESPNKTGFLTATAGLLGLQGLVWLLVLVWAANDTRGSKITYRSLKGAVMGWVFFGLSLGLKLACGLAGRYFRSFLKVAYVIDLVLSTLCIFCLYNFFDMSYQDQYLFYGVYVLVFSVTFVSSCAGLIVSIASTRGTRPLVPAIVMILLNFVVIAVFYTKYDSVILKASILTWMMVFFALVDFYLAFDFKQFLKYRAHKFYINDSTLAFFCLWTDWFSFFWLDSLNNSKLIKKLRRKAKTTGDQAPKAPAKPAAAKPKARKEVEVKKDVESHASSQNGEPSDGPESISARESSVRVSVAEGSVEI